MAATVRFEPDDVAAATFAVGRRGYETDEVRAYLKGVSAELGRLRRECDELRAQLAAKPREVVDLDEGEVAQRLGEEAARVLTTAREAATQIRTRSEEAAAALVDEANEDAARTREHADVEAARLRHEAQLQAEAEIEGAKREGRDMVAEARAVRERMLDDVRRRREVAKAQLEQLRLGHERVLGTFELAADALAAVTADLRALVPDVRRNSAVETGPVPTVLPVGERERADADVEAAVVEAPVVVPAGPPPAVHISVPNRPASVDPAPAEAGPDAEPAVDVEAEAGDDRPTVLVRAFSLGEAPPEDERRPEPAGAPEPLVIVDEVAAEVEPEVEPEAEPVDESAPSAALEPEPEVEVEIDAVEASVEPVEDVTVDDVVTEEPGDADAVGETTVEESIEDVVEEVAAEEDVVEEVVAAEEVVEEVVVDEPVVADDAVVEDAIEVTEPATEPTEPTEPVEPETEGADAVAGHPRPSADDLFARIRAARQAVTRDAVRATAVPLEAPAPEPEPVRAAVLVADPEPDAGAGVDVVAARNVALAPVEVALARRLKRALADEQNEVLDRLRRKNPVLTLEGLVGTSAEHAGAYEAATQAEMGPAVTAGARSLRPDLGDAEVAAQTGGVVAAVLGSVRDEVVAPLRERLARLLDGTPDAATVTDGVRTVYREWKTQRLDAAARHLALVAHGQAAYAVLVPGTSVCWRIDPAQPCPDGEDNALGGPTPAGEPFPTGHLSAPAYVGCRCTLAPAAR